MRRNFFLAVQCPCQHGVGLVEGGVVGAVQSFGEHADGYGNRLIGLDVVLLESISESPDEFGDVALVLLDVRRLFCAFWLAVAGRRLTRRLSQGQLLM